MIRSAGVIERPWRAGAPQLHAKFMKIRIPVDSSEQLLGLLVRQTQPFRWTTGTLLKVANGFWAELAPRRKRTNRQLVLHNRASSRSRIGKSEHEGRCRIPGLFAITRDRFNAAGVQVSTLNVSHEGSVFTDLRRSDHSGHQKADLGNLAQFRPDCKKPGKKGRDFARPWSELEHAQAAVSQFRRLAVYCCLQSA